MTNRPYVAAVGQGLLSSALRDRLTQAEAELERLQQAPKPIDAERLLPGLPAIFRRKVEEIDRLAEREPGRAQQAIKTALQAEAIRLWPSADGSHLRAEYEIEPALSAVLETCLCTPVQTRSDTSAVPSPATANALRHHVPRTLGGNR